jgi:hypothetical protein
MNFTYPASELPGRVTTALLNANHDVMYGKRDQNRLKIRILLAHPVMMVEAQ